MSHLIMKLNFAGKISTRKLTTFTERLVAFTAVASIALPAIVFAAIISAAIALAAVVSVALTCLLLSRSLPSHSLPSHHHIKALYNGVICSLCKGPAVWIHHIMPHTCRSSSQFLQPQMVVLTTLPDGKIPLVHLKHKSTGSWDYSSNPTSVYLNILSKITTFIHPLHWLKATNFPESATHTIDFGPGGLNGIGPLTARNFEGRRVHVTVLGEKGRGSSELYDSKNVKFEDWWTKKWTPKLVKTRYIAFWLFSTRKAFCANSITNFGMQRWQGAD